MLDELYNRRILELAADIPHQGRLEKPQASASAHSKLCGSTITVDLVMSGDIVTEFAQDVKACALGQAAASILGQHVIGSNAAELRALRAAAHAILTQGATPPMRSGEDLAGKWKDLRVLEPVRAYKARHASILLGFDAVVEAIGKIEAEEADRSKM